MFRIYFLPSTASPRPHKFDHATSRRRACGSRSRPRVPSCPRLRCRSARSSTRRAGARRHRPDGRRPRDARRLPASASRLLYGRESGTPARVPPARRPYRAIYAKFYSTRLPVRDAQDHFPVRQRPAGLVRPQIVTARWTLGAGLALAGAWLRRTASGRLQTALLIVSAAPRCSWSS